jgi:GWxTD domain-containing protein
MSRHVRLRSFASLTVVVFGLFVTACGGSTATTPPGAAPGPSTPAGRAIPGLPAMNDLTPVDVVQLYRQMGLFAEGAPLPFVGSVSYLAGRSTDSTLALVTLSLANRALTFARENDRYTANYNVTLEARRGDGVLARVTTNEQVKVAAYRETGRLDESVIFEQLLVLPPGTADLQVTVRDEGSGRVATATRPLVVPKLGAGRGISSPVPFYQVSLRTSLDSMPRFVPSPRSTVVFGRDSTFPVYVEAYGAGERVNLRARVQTEGATLFVDSLPLLRRGNGLFSGVLDVPVRRLGIGVTTLDFTRADGADTVTVPIFVSFGDDLPVATFDQMLSYLRYFATSSRLRTLKDVPTDRRAEAWARFVAETDPNPQTSAHEGLQSYFQRLQYANTRFRDEGMPGWLTDRGMVSIVLGDPESQRESNPMDVGQRGRALVWEYPSRRLTLVFVDQTGFGRWRLTMSSQADFQNIARSIQERNG